MSYATGTIAGTFRELDATATTADVYVALTGITPALVKDTAGDVVLSGTLHQQLVDGTVTFEGLPATDDPALNPTGFGYQIQIRRLGRETVTVTTDLPAGGTVQIEDLIDAPAPTFNPTATYIAAGDTTTGGDL